MTEPSGNKYHENRTGPRVETWGTPDISRAEEEERPLTVTAKVPSDKHDSNHWKTAPWRLIN